MHKGDPLTFLLELVLGELVQLPAKDECVIFRPQVAPLYFGWVLDWLSKMSDPDLRSCTCKKHAHLVASGESIFFRNLRFKGSVTFQGLMTSPLSIHDNR